MKIITWTLIAIVSLYVDVFLLGGPLLSALAALIGVIVFAWDWVRRRSFRSALAHTRLLPALALLPLACTAFGLLLNQQIAHKVVQAADALEGAYRLDGKWPTSMDAVKPLAGQAQKDRIWIGSYWIQYFPPDNEHSKASLYFKKYGGVRQVYLISERRFEEETPD
jgi:hypothetical protein